MKATPKKITPLSPHEFKPIVSINNKTYIYIQPQALRDLQTIIHLTSLEIGALGLVKTHKGNVFEIYEIILPKQEIAMATCEMTPDGMGEVAEQLITDRPDEYNNLRIWIHSHHTMGISPSTQDNNQWKELTANCNDYFIRGICNQKGDLKLDINLISEGIQIIDVPWAVIQTGNNNRDKWIEEFEAKCKPITYATNSYDWHDNWRDNRKRHGHKTPAPTAHAKRLFKQGWRCNPMSAIAKNSLTKTDDLGTSRYRTVSVFIYEDIETLELDKLNKKQTPTKAENIQEAMNWIAQNWESDPHSNYRLRLLLKTGGYIYKEVGSAVQAVVESMTTDWDDYLDSVNDVAKENIQNYLPGMKGLQDDIDLLEDIDPPNLEMTAEELAKDGWETMIGPDPEICHNNSDATFIINQETWDALDALETKADKP